MNLVTTVNMRYLVASLATSLSMLATIQRLAARLLDCVFLYGLFVRYGCNFCPNYTDYIISSQDGGYGISQFILLVTVVVDYQHR